MVTVSSEIFIDLNRYELFSNLNKAFVGNI